MNDVILLTENRQYRGGVQLNGTILSNQLARTASVYRLQLFDFHALCFGIIQVTSQSVINTK